MAYMPYTEVTDLRWMNAEHSYIQCNVKFAHLPAAVPFGATPDDIEDHGREIFEYAAFGLYGDISPYVPPKVPTVDLNAGAPLAIA